jgi:DnaA family protein
MHAQESLFYLWGQPGSGKSHLIEAYISKVNAQGQTAVVFKPSDISTRENVSLIEIFDFICIDQVEQIATNKSLEEALFFWINEVKQANKKILLASQLSNKSTKWQLPDLRSRLQAGRTHEIKSLEREEALKVFQKQAINKGLILNERILNYLKNNSPMEMSFLSQLVQKLDQVTLAEKKQVTIPLLKRILLEK